MVNLPRPVLVFDTTAAPLTPPRSFIDACAEAQIEFDDGEIEQLGRYLALLLEANRVINLTSITDPEQAWHRHIFDALTLLPLLGELGEDALIVDVGSGGGVPGIPLAITMPHLRFELVEATRKKAGMLDAFVGILGLSNVRVLAERAEVLGQNRAEHRERAAVAVARAVGKVSVIAELTAPLVRVGGTVLLIKGAQAEVELGDAGGALGMLGLAHAGTVPTPTGRIVVLDKVRPTPESYPRRPGEPKRAPLK